MGSEDDLGSEGFEAGQEICIADSVEFDGRTRVDVDQFGSADDLCAMAANRFQVGQMPVLVHGRFLRRRTGTNTVSPSASPPAGGWLARGWRRGFPDRASRPASGPSSL